MSVLHNVSINKEVHEKAKKIIADRDAIIQERLAKNEYLDTCYSAGICPICGEDVKAYYERRREHGFRHAKKGYMIQDCSTHGRVNERGYSV